MGGGLTEGGVLVLPLTGVAFPGRIMHCTVFYPLDLYPAFFGYYFFNFMMLVLQSLHIFWAYLIICMAQKLITGKVREDLGPRGRPQGGWRMGLCRGDPQILNPNRPWLPRSWRALGGEKPPWLQWGN